MLKLDKKDLKKFDKDGSILHDLTMLFALLADKVDGLGSGLRPGLAETHAEVVEVMEAAYEEAMDNRHSPLYKLYHYLIDHNQGF